MMLAHERDGVSGNICYVIPIPVDDCQGDDRDEEDLDEDCEDDQ